MRKYLYKTFIGTAATAAMLCWSADSATTAVWPLHLAGFALLGIAYLVYRAGDRRRLFEDDYRAMDNERF
ncbi:MAG: hypothetical protein K6F98_05735 [Bacteroidales bacterium]|nr:hypothetical protein [Bacteroidales bacterium]